MNLNEYKTLSGITVSSGDESYVTAQIDRTQYMLETMLGFTLDSTKVTENIYDELGQTQQECACSSVDTESLLPADEVNGAYRLYNYNKQDKYFHIDPASDIYSIKLVYIKEGSGVSGVTLKTLDIDTIRLHLNNYGFINYIEHCKSCFCDCDCDCVQLAVDADWLWENNLPKDLMYLWADMITYYSDKKLNIKSESIDSHSYTKGDTKAPETEPRNIAILKKYAGPRGSIAVQPL